MTDDRMPSQDDAQPSTARLAYVTPRLERFGTFADLTKAANGYCM